MEQEINYKKILEAQKAEEKKLMAMKPEIRFNEQLYKLRFDMYAFELIEQEFGGVREAMNAINPNGGGKVLPTAKKLFAILANSQRNMDGLPENVTGEEIPKHAPISKLLELSDVIKAAIVQGRYSETVDCGPASDKKKNPLEEEYEAKNG